MYKILGLMIISIISLVACNGSGSSGLANNQSNLNENNLMEEQDNNLHYASLDMIKNNTVTMAIYSTYNQDLIWRFCQGIFLDQNTILTTGNCANEFYRAVETSENIIKTPVIFLFRSEDEDGKNIKEIKFDLKNETLKEISIKNTSLIEAPEAITKDVNNVHFTNLSLPNYGLIKLKNKWEDSKDFENFPPIHNLVKTNFFQYMTKLNTDENKLKEFLIKIEFSVTNPNFFYSSGYGYLPLYIFKGLKDFSEDIPDGVLGMSLRRYDKYKTFRLRMMNTSHSNFKILFGENYETINSDKYDFTTYNLSGADSWNEKLSDSGYTSVPDILLSSFYSLDPEYPEFEGSPIINCDNDGKCYLLGIYNNILSIGNLSLLEFTSIATKKLDAILSEIAKESN